MRVIRLTRGSGNGVDEACLMTASNMLIGCGEQGDKNNCVCPLLRAFILPTNDSMPKDTLGELYGPMVFEILGTRSEYRSVMTARMLAFVDWFLRDFSVSRMKYFGHDEQARKRAELPPIVDAKTLSFSMTADLNDSEHSIVTLALNDLDRPGQNWDEAVACDVSHAVCREYVLGYKQAFTKCPEIIRRIAAIGERKQVATCLSWDDLAHKLDRQIVA